MGRRRSDSGLSLFAIDFSELAMRTAFLIVFLTASTALAHDFWIEPSTFRPHVGTNVLVSLRVGQEFVGDPVARDSSMIERFVVRDAAGERAIPGLERRDPAGYLAIERSGVAIIGYRSRPKFLEMPPEKFEQYLKDEGLESIIATRAKRGDSLKPSKEIFSRCAKALILADGSGTGVRFDTPLAFRYEIVAKTNPYSIKNDDLQVVVLFEGKPLSNALVVAMHQEDSSLRIHLRSDAKGRVTFHLPKRGVWLIKSVQMVPAPAGSNADWESLWASLTFER
ncbi:MAG: hypothetical protein QOK37_3598 [Thermoanaerobaculia bacterium]|jgi:uncharacterized GH25 family protein|nr:hypothetical protein [Thermoanaerobaculia bacterium]